MVDSDDVSLSCGGWCFLSKGFPLVSVIPETTLNCRTPTRRPSEHDPTSFECNGTDLPNTCVSSFPPWSVYLSTRFEPRGGIGMGWTRMVGAGLQRVASW